MFSLSRTLVSLSVAIILTGIAGCSVTGERDQVPVDQAVGLALQPPRVRLIEKGESPRNPLIFQDHNTPTQAATVKVGSSLSQQISTGDTLSPQPSLDAASPAVTTLKVTAESVPAQQSEESTRSVFLKVRSANSDTDLDTARGFGFGWFADDSGRISSVNFAAPTQATDAARAQTEDSLLTLVGLPVVFPQEPVGVGARWTVESRITSASASYLQDMTFELLERSGSVVRLGVSVQQRPSQGAIEAQGEKLEVISAESVSEGELVIDTSHPLPVSGSLKVIARVIYAAAGNEVRVVQDNSTVVEFVPPQ
ncbi:hypothetical protein N7326_01995 [Corynebacterium sp. ES2794-CONJ1]|uniref:hypothetical protein n=1 Tax=Corynebacterium sp. ES2794-CONJ1 TaxID=2980553 RepID=UPI0021D9A3B2|nr:hypothetical protein [Corynebacterium sp. ES2794-CONJ1]MCU9518644.1 hypothetical protein [Corynebacterium sp. ES2794-CONJ1]